MSGSNALSDGKILFYSKSNTLKFLQNKLKKSKIEKIYDFTISDWKKNEQKILDHVSKNFDSKIIVRSSAKGEDSETNSQAGSYQSILNILPNYSKQVKEAINSVIQSYQHKKNINDENQIFIQTQTQNIVLSGVIFTRTRNLGSPYYVINFDESDSTVRVTSGQIGKTVKIFRNSNLNSVSPIWKTLLKSINEIETILSRDDLDIEFAITKRNTVVIFQVRPITFLQNLKIPKLDKKIEKIISFCENKYLKLKTPSHLFGKSTIFSDMADWNPAEIIGNDPNSFDYSLYDYLIMKENWHLGRKKIGYQNVSPSNLMVKFGNKPYVNVKASFNSLIPSKISNKLKEKLMDFYLKKLINTPHLHDKVEFEILFTCYDFSLDERLKELNQNHFNKKEIIQIRSELINFTNCLIENYSSINTECNKSIQLMSENRLKIKSKIKTKNFYSLLNAAENLLKDCKCLGTTSFSTMARIAFIGSILLKSLLKQNKISQHFYHSFMNSISTTLSDFQHDYESYANKLLLKEEFLEKYGHLRPGTYDITAQTYMKNENYFDNLNFVKSIRSKPNIDEMKNLHKIIDDSPLIFKNIDFFDFIEGTLVQREKLKFEFTHNVSDAIELIAEAGEMLGFTRDELSYLNIQSILNYKKHDKSKLKLLWKQKIRLEQKKKSLNSYLELSPIIFSKKDFKMIQYFASKPNYITNKSVKSSIISLTSKLTTKDLGNKIVLIENADPGYDWIFTKNISGLITKYGGVASHMAIRCAEIGLPASIGCGDILFEKLLDSSKVMLDCKNQQIIILEHHKNDEYVEEKKMLKTLGYIK